LRYPAAEGSFEIELGLPPEESPTPRQKESFDWDIANPGNPHHRGRRSVDEHLLPAAKRGDPLHLEAGLASSQASASGH
jgi:hypothetical protein